MLVGKFTRMTGRRLYCFTQAGCPYCPPTAQAAKAAAAADGNVSYEEVDVRTSPDLVEQYGISATPTVVYVCGTEEAGRLVGQCDETAIAKLLSKPCPV